MVENKFKLVGISLAISGIPYGMYLNTIYPVIKWTPIVMILSVLLTINWRNLLAFKFPNSNRMVRFLISFHLFMIVYYLFGYDDSFQWLSFHLFIVAFCYSIMSLPKSFNFSDVPEAVFIITIPLVLFGLFVCFNNLVVGEEAYYLRQSDTGFVIEPFTVACGALYNMFAGLCILDKNKIFKLVVIITTIMGIYILFSCIKRTPIFVYIIGLGLFLLKSKQLFNVNKRLFIKYTIVSITIFVVLYLSNEYVSANVNDFINNMITGVRNLLGDTSVSDDTGSAIERANNRATAYNHIDQHWTSVNYIFGNGYFMYWLDSPFLQSYFDMGLIGFICYIYTVVVYPFKIFRYKYVDTKVLYALLLCVYGIVSIFSAGHPYQSEHYVCVILLAVFVNNNKFLKHEQYYSDSIYHI